MSGKAPDALRRKLEREWQLHAAETLLALPAQRITGWRPWPACNGSTADSNGRVVVALPDDFLRLLSLRLTDWESPVTEILAPGDWRRRLQDRRFRSLGATTRSPKAFFTSDAEGRRCLELFGSAPGTAVEIAEGWYLPIPHLDKMNN